MTKEWIPNALPKQSVALGNRIFYLSRNGSRILKVSSNKIVESSQECFYIMTVFFVIISLSLGQMFVK